MGTGFFAFFGTILVTLRDRNESLNLCEVYYDFYRANGETAGRDAVSDIFALGVQLRNDLSMDFW